MEERVSDKIDRIKKDVSKLSQDVLVLRDILVQHGFVCEDKQKSPEFKVGDWVYYTNPLLRKGLDAIFRIEAAYETADKGRFRLWSRKVGNKNDGWYEASDCRLATPQEIEQHLIYILK